MNNVMHSQFPESISEKIPITNQNYNDQIIKPPQQNIKKGDEIYYDKSSGFKIEINKEEYKVIKEFDVVIIL